LSVGRIRKGNVALTLNTASIAAIML
jgi:hypothetical protein